MRHGELSTVAIYKDNILAGHNDDDNLIYLTLETKVLKEWYNRFLRSSSRHKNLGAEEQFTKWLNEECTADDTDGLFGFAKQRSKILYVENANEVI